MAMAEIGLVRFARVAMDVARAAVPAHRSKYSKRVFAQPQLLSILCLMRYEDITADGPSYHDRRPALPSTDSIHTE